MPPEHIDGTRAALTDALASVELRTVADAITAEGSLDGILRHMALASEAPGTLDALTAMEHAIAARLAVCPEGCFERFVLTLTASRSLDRLAAAPLPDAVKRLWCEAMVRCSDGRLRVKVSERRFVGLSKIASLRRFPAGQFDWEPSGLPRSWLHRVRPPQMLAHVLRLVWQWRGFSPAYFVHMTVTRPVPALLEREAEKSYYRMAKSMELQPEVNGLIASSWLHSPDTFRVTPHLAWLNRVFLENGAVVSTMGPASPDCGVLHRSPERKKAFDEGSFAPTVGLIIWPRRDMLAWAARHPELCS
jgi:hypothetical protein